MASPRVRKIADRIQVIVAEMLERRIKDPRLGFVTVTDVRVTGDTQQATIFYTVLGERGDEMARRHGGGARVGQGADPLRGRQAARHAARADAEFIHDALPENARHLDELLAKARESDERGRRAPRGATYAGERRPVQASRARSPTRTTSTTTTPTTTASDRPSGLVVVDKPGGMTSHDVVARVRRLAGTRKVGHAGTLDPMATGVLVLGVNRATRLLGHLMLTEKAYDATIRLGVATTTDDAEGEVIATVGRRRPRRGGRPRGAGGRSSATSSRCRPRCRRSRSTASGPTSGSATARRSSSQARPVTVHELRARRPSRTAEDARRRRVGALLQRHLHPGDRPRPRRRARRRRPPDRAAAYRRRAVRPRPRAHARRAGRASSRCSRSPTPPAAASRRCDLDEAQAPDVRYGRELDARAGRH